MKKCGAEWNCLRKVPLWVIVPAMHQLIKKKKTCSRFFYTSLQIYHYWSLPTIITVIHHAFLHLPLFIPLCVFCICVCVSVCVHVCVWFIWLTSVSFSLRTWWTGHVAFAAELWLPLTAFAWFFSCARLKDEPC